MACRGSGVRVPSAPPTRRGRTPDGGPASSVFWVLNSAFPAGRWHHVLMTATDISTSTSTAQHIEATERYAAHNYHPLPVVLAEGDGAWVIDVDGRRYLDCLAGYSALNFGHSNERLVAVAREQLGRLTLTSRAFFNDKLSGFAEALTRLTGKDMILPMNSGAEAVETAIKVEPQVGLRGQGRPRGPGLDRHHEGQLPRPHHHHRQLLRRRGRDAAAMPPSPRASAPRRTATSTPSRPPSTRRPWPCSSSRSRARAVSSCRPRASCATCAHSAPSATC